MQHVEVSRTIPAPLDAVWGVYTDHAGWSRWAGFSKTWLEKEGAPDKNGTGAVRGIADGGVKVFEEVLEFEPKTRFTYRVIQGGLPMKDHLGEVVFAPEGDGTRVTWRCQFNSRIPGLGWLMRLFITRVFRKGLEGLAQFPF